jgi:hypothetical protein
MWNFAFRMFFMLETLEGLKGEAIVQFCVFVENKVGRLNQLLKMLESINVHVLALSTQDTTDSAVDRIVVDDPEKTRQHLDLNAFAFCESEVLCVEIDDNGGLGGLLTAIANAEINVFYIYPFLYRPHGKCAVAIHLDDLDLANDVLTKKGFRILKQRDLSR